MQKIPSLYGFSIITLVLVLMVINHFVYLRILENSIAETQPTSTSSNAPAEEASDVPAEEGIEDNTTADPDSTRSFQDALDESSLNGNGTVEDDSGSTDSPDGAAQDGEAGEADPASE